MTSLKEIRSHQSNNKMKKKVYLEQTILSSSDVVASIGRDVHGVDCSSLGAFQFS